MTWQIVYQWIDLIWLPLALLLTHKQHRIVAAAYVLACVFMLRLQIEFMAETGHLYGYLNFLGFHPYERGLFVYGLFNIVFLLAAHFSPGARPVIIMASALSLFFTAMFSATIIMLL